MQVFAIIFLLKILLPSINCIQFYYATDEIINFISDVMINFFPHALMGISETTSSTFETESSQPKSTYAILMTSSTATLPHTSATQKTQPTIKPGIPFQIVIHRSISKIIKHIDNLG